MRRFAGFLLALLVLTGCRKGPIRHESASFTISADTKTIVWTSGESGQNRLLIRKADGTTKTLASGAYFEHPALSPDGHTVIVSVGNNYRSKLDLVQFDVESGTRTELLKELDASKYSTDFSPDGHWVALNVGARPKSHSMGGVQWTDFDLYVMDVATRKARRLTETKFTKIFGPRWSPDGTSLIFSFIDYDGVSWLRELKLSDGSTIEETQLKNNESMPVYWGKQVVIVSDRDNFGRYRIAVVNPSNGTVTPITHEDGFYADPQVAKDKIYVLEDVTHAMRFRISEIDPKTGASQEILPESAFDPVKK